MADVEFVTYSDLRAFNSSMTREKQAELKSVAESRQQYQRKDTFLSHSSKDAEFLPAVILILQNHGASVYCDLDDNRMPEKPDPRTAAIVKSQIFQSDRLVVFVTTNSKDSKWVPWELGIGDARLTQQNVALFPAAQHQWEQSWAKHEYLGLYRHIVWGELKGEREKLWLVYDYHTHTAERLRDWCKRKGY